MTSFSPVDRDLKVATETARPVIKVRHSFSPVDRDLKVATTGVYGMTPGEIGFSPVDRDLKVATDRVCVTTWNPKMFQSRRPGFEGCDSV